MPKFRSLAKDALWVDVEGRLVKVEPGEVIDIPATQQTYMQVGDHGEPALFESVAAPKKNKEN